MISQSSMFIAQSGALSPSFVALSAQAAALVDMSLRIYYTPMRPPVLESPEKHNPEGYMKFI